MEMLNCRNKRYINYNRSWGWSNKAERSFENHVCRFHYVQLENSSERMCHFLGSSADNFYHGSRLTNSTDKILCSGIPVCNSCLSSIYENKAFFSLFAASSTVEQETWNRKRWTEKSANFLKKKLYRVEIKGNDDEKMVKFQRWASRKCSKFFSNKSKKERSFGRIRKR